MTLLLTVLSLSCVIGSTYQDTEPPAFVVHGSPDYVRYDVHELGSAEGWLRIPRLYLDFRIAFDFKPMTPDSDAGVIVRTWPGRGGWPDKGFRFRLPTDSAIDVSSVFVGHRENVTMVREGTISLRPSGEWQKLEIGGEGRILTMTLNDTLVGIFEIEKYGGHIMFDNRQGRVHLRNIKISHIDPTPETLDNFTTVAQVQKAGGQPPKPIHQVKPYYTPEAMGRKVQGSVVMKAVVLPDGSVGPIRITQSLDPDLDLSAVAVLREWKFTPGVLDGKSIPVLVYVETTFTLK